MEVLQPCKLTDQIRTNTAGEKRQKGSKRGRQGEKGREKGRVRKGMGGKDAYFSHTIWKEMLKRGRKVKGKNRMKMC